MPTAAPPTPGTVPPALARRLVLTGLLGAAGASVLPTSRAGAAGFDIASRVSETYLTAGGAAVLGTALSVEKKIRIDGHNTYAQQFAHGTVWWGSGVGKVDLPAADRVRLDTAANFRPVLGVTAMWRSDDLDHCEALEERIVHDLGIATMIAMNSGSDPSISGVKRHKFPISNNGSHLEFYRGYVTRSASREAIGHVLTTIAGTDQPVLIHCSGGKDRTGWLSDLIQAVAGVSRGVRDADYLATQDYSGGSVDLAWLQAARVQLSADYGTFTRYLTEGCGLSTQTYTDLQSRLVA